MLRVRVEVADRPGSLAGVSAVVADCSGDVAQLVVMQRGNGIAIDDIWMTLPAERSPTDVLAQLEQVDGVRVLGVRAGAAPVGFDAQLDFLAYLFAAPQRGVEAFVDMLPTVTDADWAALRDDSTGMFAHGGDDGGHALDAVIELVVSGSLTLLVGRDRGLPWHPGEVRRIVSVLELASLLIAHTTLGTVESRTGLTSRFVTSYQLAGSS
jgi:hypothetical protein